MAYEGLLRRERQLLHERVAKAIEAQLGTREGEFVETLAYHYGRSGDVDTAVGYMRRAARKALDRYAIVEAHAHWRSAYELLTGEDAKTLEPATRDRLLMDVLLEWAQGRYYTGEFGELHRLQQLHADLPARVGDDGLTARWLAWSGHATWLHLNDHQGSRQLLEQALDLGRRANDPTAQAYALAWLTWTMHSFGQCALATTYWPLIEALLPDIPDPFDRRYVQLKGRGGLAYALAARGERVAARAIAEELLEDGRRTGNRRATAMGQFPLIVLDATSGDPESGLRRAIVAAECGADPMYRVSADNWRAGMAATANGPAEALVIIEAGATDVRKLRIDHGVRRVPSVGRVPVRQARSPRSPARRCPRPLGPSRRTVGRRAGRTARARCRSAARHALNAVLLRRSGPPSMR